MRLLEFESAASGANPKTAILGRNPAKKPAEKHGSTLRSNAAIPAPGRVYTVDGSAAVGQTVRRAPIDLEQLQQRVEVLERRLRERARQAGTRLPAKDLQQLKERLKLLERSVHNELWAAKQREHSLLELLARPPLKTVISQRAKRFAAHTLPTTGRWLKHECYEWWRLSQPLWWTRLARAWREAYDQARSMPRP